MIPIEPTHPDALATNCINQRPTLDARQAILERQLRRIGRLWDRYEATGDEKWMDAANKADSLYLRLRGRLS